MFDFLIDNIFVLFGGWVFQYTIGIPMGANCAPLLADLFLHAYEADFHQGLLKNKDRKLTQTFNSIYPNELEVKDTNNTQMSTSYLDLHLEIDNGGRLITKLYDKRDDITLPIINFPFISSNIPASPVWGLHFTTHTLF